MRPRLLDLFCGAGGAAMGYHRAGFDVVGVDIKPQPRFPFEFHQADAMEVLRELVEDGGGRSALRGTGWRHMRQRFNAIHASPPCQAYSRATAWRGVRSSHPDLLGPTIALLLRSELPWIVENVPDAPMTPTFVLCGSMFGLRVRRHRYFLTSWNDFAMLPACDHRNLLAFMHKGERAYGDAMGCEWMARDGHRQAIPPAYTEWIGEHLMQQIRKVA